jgi:hypothetical protein
LPDPRLLYATRVNGEEQECEPVLVRVLGTTIAFVLDDGEELVFEASELAQTVNGEEAA